MQLSGRKQPRQRAQLGKGKGVLGVWFIGRRPARLGRGMELENGRRQRQWEAESHGALEAIVRTLAFML